MSENNEAVPQAYSLPRVVREILPLLRPYRATFWLASFLELLSRLVWLYPPYALASIVTFFSHYHHGDSLVPLGWIAGIWIIASLIHYIGEQIANYLGYMVAERAAVEATFRTLRHLLLLDLRWHEKENSGNKLKRILKGGEGIDRIVRIWFENGIESLVSFVGMTFVIAQFDLLVAAGIFVFLGSYYLMARPLTRRAGNASHVTNRMEEEVSGLVLEKLNNIRSVKVLGMGRGLLVIARGKFDDWMDKIALRIRFFRQRGVVLNSWAQLWRLGLLGAIVWGVAQGRYDVGFLVLFWSYFNYIWDSIDKLSRVSLDFVISSYGFLRMQQLLEVPVRIDREDGKRAFPQDWRTIHVRNLSFSYGKPASSGGSGHRVLDGLTFDIRRGERIGIVGLSGAGKSTLFKLLLKEHESYEGEILIEDVPLRDIGRLALFDHAAVVLQDTEVFNFGLRDNIILGNPDHAKDEDLLRRAVETAHVTDFIARLPDGLDTMIGEKGIRLSGGERQRLGIARAIFKQPQLLFLDEATSHLDLESEAKIRDSLHSFFQSVTAVVIAHRLTTIRQMDRILVLEDGKLIEQGSFDALIAQKGRFFELWERQGF